MDQELVIKLLGLLVNNSDKPAYSTLKIPPCTHIDSLIGKKVIIRTYSAGVHFGELAEKSESEVILKNARRLWYWETANKGISLSEVAMSGVSSNSKVTCTVPLIWLQAIEIIPCSDEAIKNIEAKNEYKA